MLRLKISEFVNKYKPYLKFHPEQDHTLPIHLIKQKQNKIKTSKVFGLVNDLLKDIKDLLLERKIIYNLET